MQKWARRLGGPIVSVLLFLHGLPGFIDDSVTWHSWIESISFSAIIYPLGIVGGIVFGTSEWWWPLVVSIVKGRSQSDDESSVGHAESDLEQFQALLPHIQRSRKQIAPFSGTLGKVEIALQVYQRGGDALAQIATELEYLDKGLSQLGVTSPDIWGESDDSFDKVRLRLRAWSTHLARLEAKIEQEDLEGARFGA